MSKTKFDRYYNQLKKNGKIYCKIGKKYCIYCRPIFFHLHCDYADTYIDTMTKCLRKKNEKN